VNNNENTTNNISTTLPGTVKWFNDQKGFGFIRLSDGREVFVHYTEIDIASKFRSLKDGQKVTVREVVNGQKGTAAKGVVPVGE